MAEGMSLILLLQGAVFMLLAAIGMVRMPDVLTRMHSSTKSATLGVGLIMLGVALAFEFFDAGACGGGGFDDADDAIAKSKSYDGIIGSMKAYSSDLRKRVVESVESGKCNVPEAARRYKVSEPSIERWLAPAENGHVCALATCGRSVTHVSYSGSRHPCGGESATGRHLAGAMPCSGKGSEDQVRGKHDAARVGPAEVAAKKSRSMPASGTHQE